MKKDVPCCEECRCSMQRLRYQNHRIPAWVQGLSLCNRRPQLKSSLQTLAFSLLQAMAPSPAIPPHRKGLSRMST